MARKFAVMFSEVVAILNTYVSVSKLKDFLDCYTHPLYPEQPYIDPKIYRDATTTMELLKSLFPQYINYMHYYLLENIVVTFGCDRAKELLQQYTDQRYSHKKKLKYLPGPVTDREIEHFHGTKKLKVQVEGDASDSTVEIIGELQEALGKGTGIKRAVIVLKVYVHVQSNVQPRQFVDTWNHVKASYAPKLVWAYQCTVFSIPFLV